MYVFEMFCSMFATAGLQHTGRRSAALARQEERSTWWQQRDQARTASMYSDG